MTVTSPGVTAGAVNPGQITAKVIHRLTPSGKLIVYKPKDKNRGP